jgi:hypothetical protein
MKKICLLLLVATIVILYNCEKDKDNEKTPVINCVETLYGGCNTSLEKSSGFSEENDTIIVFFENDTMTIHVGVNYICCANFAGKSETISDTLQITVTDNCSPEDSCYCRCMCYYTFDFRYTGFETGDYPCKVRLWDGIEKTFKVLFQGTISISMDQKGI